MHDDDLHFHRYREEAWRRLDVDAWRRARAGEAPAAPRDESAPRSLGRAIGEVVTAPEGDAAAGRAPRR